MQRISHSRGPGLVPPALKVKTMSKQKPAYYYLRHNETGARLCNDGRWREHHVPIGCMPGCVKQYNLRECAVRRAGFLATVVFVYPGDVLYACGELIRYDANIRR